MPALPVITLAVLTKAIRITLEVDETEARQFAETVLDLFGYDDCIIDNILEHKERCLFYRLEAEGILHTRREEIILDDGRNWRIHYRFLQKTIIFHPEMEKSGKPVRKKNAELHLPSPHSSIYSSLPEEAWAARKTYSV
jgi:hypothetical protein